MKILVVADCHLEMPKDKLPEGTVFRLVQVTTGRLTGRWVPVRHAVYGFLALRALLLSPRYDTIFFWQQFIGIYFCVCARMLHLRKPCLTGPLLYRAGSRLKQRLFSFALGYPNVRALVFTATEKKQLQDLFRVPPERVRTLQYGQSPSPFLEEMREKAIDRGYIFSGGTSHRDYPLLFDAARRLPEIAFVIACTRNDVKGLEVPANVTVNHDCFGRDFERLIAESRAVTLPLRPGPLSSGHLVLFKAMQAAKPLVLPDERVVKDVVGLAGVIFYKPSDADSLAAAIQKLKRDPAEASRIGKDGRSYYLARHAHQPEIQLLAELAREADRRSSMHIA